MLWYCLVYYSSSYTPTALITSRYWVIGALQRPENCCFFFVRFAIDWLHLQPLNPLLDPCDSELSGLLGVPLPTLQDFMLAPEGINLNGWNLERDGESGGAGGGGGLASSAASRNTWKPWVNIRGGILLSIRPREFPGWRQAPWSQHSTQHQSGLRLQQPALRWQRPGRCEIVLLLFQDQI